MSALAIIPKKNFPVLRNIFNHLGLNGEQGNVVLYFAKDKMILFQKEDESTLLTNVFHLERAFFTCYKTEDEVAIDFVKFREISKFFSSIYKSVTSSKCWDFCSNLSDCH